MSDPQRLIDALHARSPGAVELATLASIAAQAEPELLRKLRLRLLPHVDGGAEGDLWLSDLVDSTSPFAMVLDAAVQRRLQDLLALDAEALEQAAAIVREAHADVEEAMRVQEEVTFLGLKADAASRARIEEILKPLVATMHHERHPGLEGWAIRAFRQFPPAAHSSGAAKDLLQAGLAAGKPNDEVLRSIPRVRLGVRMLAATVEIRPLGEHDPRTRVIEVPMSETLQLDVAWSPHQAPRAMTFAAGQTLEFPRESDDLFLTTILRDTYILSLNVAADDWALVIGVGEPVHTEGAQAMEEWLVSPSGGRMAREHVFLHTSLAETSADAITERIDELVTRPGERRRVVVYFAGHSQPADDDVALRLGFGNSLSVTKIVRKLRRNFSQLVFIADTHAEEIAPIGELHIPRGAGHPVSVVIAAVPPEKAGDLTRTLIRILRERNERPGWASVSSLRDAVTRELESARGISVSWFRAGEMHLVEPRAGLFQIRLEIPPEWQKHTIRVIDEAEQRLDVNRRRPSLLVPPGLYSIEIPELSYSRPVTAGTGAARVPLAWRRREEWIAVAGTGAYRLTEGENQMARKMGRKLAGAGFGLVVGGEEGVDFVCADLFTQTLQIFGESNAESLRQFSVAQPHYRHGRHIPVNDREQSYEQPLNLVRALIIIGGHDGTHRYVRRADRRRVPVIPIAGTGSAAEEVYAARTVSTNLPEWLTTRVGNDQSATLMAERVIRYLETILR
jgi:hypothetical protein